MFPRDTQICEAALRLVKILVFASMQPCLLDCSPFDRKAMLEFIKVLNIDYDASFRCPICSKLRQDGAHYGWEGDGTEKVYGQALHQPFNGGSLTCAC